MAKKPNFIIAHVVEKSGKKSKKYIEIISQMVYYGNINDKRKEKMSKKTKYIIIGFVVATGLLCVILGSTYPGEHKCDDVCKYGTETVEVLENYKKGIITPEELKRRIDKLEKLLEEEEDKTDPLEEESHRVFSIRIELISMRIKLMATNYIPYYEVDEAINNIKENL